MTSDLGTVALTSWAWSAPVTALLLLILLLYLRGWQRGRRIWTTTHDWEQLWAFCGGLFLVFLAVESPLDTFDSLFLSAHMTQHLILMMFAPPLLLLSQPVLPLLRGLPKRFLKVGLGPFLTWPALRRVLHALVSPPVAWLLFAGSTVVWHVPWFYELALRSPAWHGAEHACFFWSGILFWWPIIQPGSGVRKSSWPAWAPIPYLMLSDFVNTALSALFIFSGRVLYPSYQSVHFAGVSALNDQILAGAIMWVPGSIVYLVPAFVIAVRFMSPARAQRGVPHSAGRRPAPAYPSAWKRFAPPTRRVFQYVMLLLAGACIWDGFAGPPVTETNLAGVLPWIHWRVLSIAALLLVGNLFCAVCPFTLFRDLGRKLLPPARLRWPRVLRNKWIPIALLLLYLWAYEAFALWNNPAVTAILLLAYFVGALLIDGFFRGASFCKYVCPIGQFHFVASLVSPREVGIKQRQVCDSCRSYDCIRGNEHSRGCELNLFQPKKLGNLDCTFCLDCVKACPHDNVALTTILPASTLLTDPYRSSIGRLSRRMDWLVLTLLVTFGAFVNAAGMIAPVMTWEHHWHAFLGPLSLPWINGALVLSGCLIFPALLVSACTALSGRADWRRFASNLVPIGIAMWAAHLFFHGATSWTGAVPAVERFLTGAITMVPGGFVPSWLRGLQILILDGGLLLTLWLLWRTSTMLADRTSTAWRSMIPWAALSCSLYAAGIWILFQPMQMRGMMH